MSEKDYENYGLWQGILGGMNNPMIPGGAVVAPVLSVIPDAWGVAAVTSTPGQVFLGMGKGVGDLANGTVDTAVSLVPSKTAIALLIVLLLAVFLVIGKVERL